MRLAASVGIGRLRFLVCLAGIACILAGNSRSAASPIELPWHAQWIGPIGTNAEKMPTVQNLWTCYRRTFTIAKKPVHAIGRIAVDSRYWLWINGRQVVFEGGLKRGPTPTDTYYDSIDLAPYLSSGTNTIAVLTWYWGKDGFSHKSSGKPGLLFEMNAGGQLLLSDKSWRVKIHPAYGKAPGAEPNPRLSEFPIRFDAREDLVNWMAADYSDTSWQAASQLGTPPSAPWNGLWARPIPQWKNSGLRDYENAAQTPAQSTGEILHARLPYNAQITPYLKIDAPAGLTITVRTDDSLNEINTTYITRAGVQEFEALAWMNGHNVLYEIPAGIKILALKYRETGYDTNLSGTFTCENEFYNRLWTKAQRTLYVTMRDNYMDCPDRERAQWWGDAVNEIGETFYALSPSSAALTRKAISNLIEWQAPDHSLFSPCPAGNWDKELPPQMLASVGKYGFWTYYLSTGDKQTIAAAYPHVRDYLSLWKLDASGLIAHRAGGWDWGDWGDNIDARLLDNAWFCLALEGTANMADVLGKQQEAAAYRTQRNALISAVNRQMWNGQAYRTSDYKGATDDRGNGLAVVAGIAEPAKFSALRHTLTAEEHASPYMEKYVLEAFVLMNDADGALSRMERRYHSIVATPLTTLPEEWHGGSDNHGWSGGPLTILSQYIAGIAPLSPGYKTYQVRPQMGALRHIHAVVDCAGGKIDLTIARENDSFRLTLVSPAGKSAVVCLPVSAQSGSNKGQNITINGKVVWSGGRLRSKAAGVTFRGADSAYVRFTVAPGTWNFVEE